MYPRFTPLVESNAEDLNSVPTSLQFTSDSGTSPSSESPVDRRQSSLDNVIRTSPVVRFLSPALQRKKEEELRHLEVEREERRRGEEIEDLQPLPSKDGGVGITVQGSDSALATPISQEPLLTGTEG